LRGKKVLITAGPTREFVDPARFLSNPSTGRMGYALAREAASRGAEVVLVTGPTELSMPSGATVVRIVTTAEMLAAIQHHFPGCDMAIFAGAPADYRPAESAPTKSPKADSLQLNLVPTEDIAAWACQNRREGQILIAFAAETHDAEKHGFEKMKRKNADFVVVNNISRDDIGFASEDNEVVILGKDHSRHLIPKSSKANIATAILDHCAVAV
jgi:phosphopantothenoylcysteine decarboxylase/phosphopantothenate--cysteine ligase